MPEGHGLESVEFELLENGLDFIASGLEAISRAENKGDLKYGVLHLVSCLQRSFTTADLSDNCGGRCGPDERLGLFVVFSDIGMDGLSQFGDAMEGSSADALPRDLCEPSLDEIDPGCAGWGEVQVIPRVRLKPFFHLRMRMGAVVVQDQMNLPVLGCVDLDSIQEQEELTVTVAR